MTKPEDKLIQYLNEAHATELALVTTLRAHIAMTPTGSYRSLLEAHLDDTRRHAARLEGRLRDLGAGRSLVDVSVGAVQSMIGQVLSLAKGPIDLLRGSGGEEKLLKNAKDECATEALEISTYDALEQVALELGDELTAEIAAQHRADEEEMLAGLREQIPGLARDAVAADVYGVDVYEPGETGASHMAQEAAGAAAGLANEAAQQADKVASRATGAAKDTAKQARRVPGVETAEGEARGAVADEGDVPIANYDSLKVADIVDRLPQLSQVELGVVDAYERKNDNRKTVLDKIESLSGDAPWAGYDEQSADEIESRVRDADDDEAREVRDYERRHKARKGVLETAERAVATS